MAPLLGFTLLSAVVGLFVLALHRAPELFVLRVRRGDAVPVRFVRGRIPPQLLQDLRDILDVADCRGTVRVLTEGGAVVVRTRGEFQPSTEQRVRNAVGLYPLAKLRNGTRPRR